MTLVRCDNPDCNLPIGTTAEPGAAVIAGVLVHGRGKGLALQCPHCKTWTPLHRGNPKDSHLTICNHDTHTSS